MTMLLVLQVTLLLVLTVQIGQVIMLGRDHIRLGRDKHGWLLVAAFIANFVGLIAVISSFGLGS